MGQFSVIVGVLKSMRIKRRSGRRWRRSSWSLRANEERGGRRHRGNVRLYNRSRAVEEWKGSAREIDVRSGRTYLATESYKSARKYQFSERPIHLVHGLSHARWQMNTQQRRQGLDCRVHFRRQDHPAEQGPSPWFMVSIDCLVEDGRAAEDAAGVVEERGGGDVQEEAAGECVDGRKHVVIRVSLRVSLKGIVLWSAGREDRYNLYYLTQREC